MNSRPFVPAFLKRLDKSLLLNRPAIWSARTHLVIWFAFLFSVILVLLCTLFFSDARQESNPAAISGFVVVISVISFVFWIIYLLRFNVFKRFGNWHPMEGLAIFILFLINILIIVSAPVLPAATESFIANRKYSERELINDINRINIDINTLEYAVLPHNWGSDTVAIVNEEFTIADRRVTDTLWTKDEPVGDQYHTNYTYLGRHDLSERLANADSSMRVNDSMYILFSAPSNIFVRTYSFRGHIAENLLSPRNLYDTLLRQPNPDRSKMMNEMNRLRDKYTQGVPVSYNDYGEGDEGYNVMKIIRKKYDIERIDDSIYRIESKKMRWAESGIMTLHFIWYISLLLALLVFIFRHSTAKAFFISILTGVILAIVTGLFVMVGRFEILGTCVLVFVYIALFAGIGFTAASARTRTLVQGVAVNMLLFSIPFIPLLITATYFNIKTEELYDDPHFAGNTDLYYFFAEAAGFILLLLLIEPVFRKLYRAWYAAPEQ